MKAICTWKYLPLLAVVGFWSCNASRQTAQNVGEVDDLYGSSGNAIVYKPNTNSKQSWDRTERNRNNSSNELLSEQKQTVTPYGSSDEYYSEFSARDAKRGISPDPGWSSSTYNDGFVDGYNAANWSNWRWNRWGWNTPGFGTGFSLGLGLGTSPWSWNNWGWNSWRYGGFYDPFWGGSYVYNPYYYNGLYDPFWGPSYYGSGWYNRPTIIVNRPSYNLGADRHVVYGARSNSTARERYNDAFINSPSSTGGNTGGRRSGELTSSNNHNYYSSNTAGSSNANNPVRSRQNNQGDYYYSNGGSFGAGARLDPDPNNSYTAPSYSGSRGSPNRDYYTRPRQNSSGTYATPSDNGGSRFSTPQSQPHYETPSFNQQQRSNGSQPSQIYSSPSFSNGTSRSSNGGSYGNSSGSSSGGSFNRGSSRGPR